MNQEETMLLHKERYKKTIKNLTVMSDIFARNVFKDKKACEYVLRIIMEDKDLTVIDNETQVDFRNMHGRGVVLDCVAKDRSGRVINVDIRHVERRTGARTPDSPYRPDNPRERQGVRGRGTLHLRGFEQGRWRRAWKTDARFPCEGSKGYAGGSIERPRA